MVCTVATTACQSALFVDAMPMIFLLPTALTSERAIESIHLAQIIPIALRQNSLCGCAIWIFPLAGLSWEESLDCCPPGVKPACDNAAKSVTITGNKIEVLTFVESLKENGIFARNVNTNDVAFHSSHMQLVYPAFLEELRKVLKTNLS